MLRWFEEPGANSDIILSSRVRLARNINAYPFSTKITEEQTERMLGEAGKAVLRLPLSKDYHDYILEDLSETEKEALVERSVISPYLAGQERAMFFVSEDEKNTIMLNEEDHIRILCTESGLNLSECYDRAQKLDDGLGRHVSYAYDDNFGYLTTCPSNVGTGMKASLIMHLPALGNYKKIQALMREIGHFGINMDSIFGDDGNTCGHLYKISNQKTLGLSEEEIIHNLTDIAGQICEQERECRKQIIKTSRSDLCDEVYKSYGILRYSRKLGYDEAMLFLSEVKLGITLGLMSFSENPDFILFQLMIGARPANLKLIKGGEPDEEQLEEIRAEFIRNNLPQIN